jgi:TonB family protein
MKGRSALFGGAALAIIAIAAQAQEPGKKTHSGVLNGRAVSLPAPEYPQTARDAGIEGVIAVDVVIDEAGNVISAVANEFDQRERKAADGTRLEPQPADPALRAAAEAAALNAKFSPTFLGGRAVKVRGRVVYNFVAKDAVRQEAADPVGSKLLNGRAVSLPTPEYPDAARAVGAKGIATVKLTIGEDGRVISAAAVSGHPLLRAAAVKAALEARFQPILVNGSPVKVSGIVTYNFVLPDK